MIILQKEYNCPTIFDALQWDGHIFVFQQEQEQQLQEQNLQIFQKAVIFLFGFKVQLVFDVFSMGFYGVKAQS